LCFFSRRLKRLNLGGNELTRIPTQALSSLELLKKLEMQENRISSIKEGDFEGKINKLFILQYVFSNISVLANPILQNNCNFNQTNFFFNILYVSNLHINRALL